MKRVVVTGIGMVTSLGLDKQSSFENICNGKTGVDKISLFDASEFPVQIAAEVKGFDPSSVIEDGKEIKKECGNFYGILKLDCIEAAEDAENIILYTSYKDIEQLKTIKEKGISLNIVNLRFKDIEKGVRDRIEKSNIRNHSELDIQNRILSALNDERIYGEEVLLNATSVVYTDMLDEEQTYNKVCRDIEKTKQISSISYIIKDER